MSVIAITDVPVMWSIKSVMLNLAKIINGYFEVINFSNLKARTKDCYVRLGPSLNPMMVVENINNGANKYKAFIPENLPDFETSQKPKKLPKKLRRKLNIKVDGIPHSILNMTHVNIMSEMQHRYPGLVPLMQKSKRKLYDALSEVVHKRLYHILETNPDSREKCFILSKYYRRSHPHFADFQLILSTLHNYEQSLGLPKSEISEKSLSTIRACPSVMSGVPANKLKAARSKYTKQITKKVLEHIKQLDINPNPNDTKEFILRKKVRIELKKMTPFLSAMINQAIDNNLVVPSPKLIKVLMYGEPFLPNKDTIRPFLKKHNAKQIVRSKFMHNLIRFEVASKDYGKLMGSDGVLLACGARLFIRPANLEIIKENPNAMRKNTSVEDVAPEEDDEFMEGNFNDDLY